MEGGEWDAVIDNSSYVPRHVADSARLLANAAPQYLFVSSISAYASFEIANDANRDCSKPAKSPSGRPTEGAYGKAALVSGERAHSNGLTHRPTRETARDTLRWWQTLPAERTQKLRAGLSPERETALLAEWRQSTG